jgi:hypothetical protein
LSTLELIQTCKASTYSLYTDMSESCGGHSRLCLGCQEKAQDVKLIIGLPQSCVFP